eukprot:scaffold113801_cov27-Prasinocladus_malaysianus.AAC.2
MPRHIEVRHIDNNAIYQIAATKRGSKIFRTYRSLRATYNNYRRLDFSIIISDSSEEQRISCYDAH